MMILRKLVFPAILAVFVISQMFFLLKYHFVIWDEAVYIGIGKFIYSFGSVGLWEVIRPLGFSFFLGFLWKIGVGIVAYQLLVLFSAVGVVVLTYLISRGFAGIYASAFAAMAVAFSPIFFVNSTSVLVDIPSLFLVVFAVYSFLKGRIVLSGFFSAAAFMFRFPHFLIVIPIIVSMIFLSKKGSIFGNLIRFSAPLLAVSIMFMALNYFAYSDSVSNALHAALRPLILASLHQSNQVYAVNGLLNDLLFYFNALFSQNVFFLFFIPGSFIMLGKGLRKSLVIVLASVIYIAYFTVIVNKQERFLIAFLPFVAVLSACWLGEAIVYIRKSPLFLKVSLSFSLFVLFIFAFATVLREDYKLYTWQLAEEPSIVRDVYRFFDTENGKTILTTDPAFAAFSDNLFIPFYDSPDEALKIYEGNKGRANFVIYTPDFYPCEGFGAECEQKKAILFDSILENRLLLNRSYEGKAYYIFSTT